MHSLCREREIAVADSLKQYAEPLSGSYVFLTIIERLSHCTVLYSV